MGSAVIAERQVIQRGPSSGLPKRDGVVEVRLSASRLAHPTVFALVGVFLATVPALISTTSQHARWGVAWWMTPADWTWTVVAATCVLLGTVVGAGRRRSKSIALRVDVSALDRAANILIVVCLLGYVAWTWSAFRHGLSTSMLLSALKGVPGANYAARDVMVTVPGLSTLTEVAPVLVAVLTLLWRCGRKRRVTLLAVVGITVVRMIVNSERLSIIEVLLPILLVLTLVRPRQNQLAKPRARSSIRLVLTYLVTPAALLGLFALTERSRSWTSHYESHYSGGLFSFSFDRIWAYYATATNNGAVYEHFLAPVERFPDLTLTSLTHAPGVGELLGTLGFAPDSTAAWAQTLTDYANPALNNTSSFLPIIGEIGVPLALLLFLGWGLMLGRIYRSAQVGRTAAIMAYAGMALGLLELARYPFYSSGRFIPAVVAALLVRHVLRDRRAGAPLSMEVNR